MTNPSTKTENLETWLSVKPYWERYVWKLNFEKDSLSDQDIDQCYGYLLEFAGVVPETTKPEISFKQNVPEEAAVPDPEKTTLVAIKNLQNVNALSPDCIVEFGPKLTLVYGGNGSGKSGIGRLMCNACFSRGEREILPNIKNPTDQPAKATFVLSDGSGNETELSYEVGQDHEELKAFSVFDSKSVTIHLDESNNVKFTPGQIKIFDKVASTISILESKLRQENLAKRKENPFEGIFVDGQSNVSNFCERISARTDEADLIKITNYSEETDEAALKKLTETIDAKKKLDIGKRKQQLSTDVRNLNALKSTIQGVFKNLNSAAVVDFNTLVDSINEKKALIQSLSVSSFNDGIFETIGSSEWKALIVAAKTLHNAEIANGHSEDFEHCLLCHQKLSEPAKTLFQKYWEFLESKAESELILLERQRKVLLESLILLQTSLPKFADTDTGVQILQEDAPAYLAQLKIQFASLTAILKGWISGVQNTTKVDAQQFPIVDLSTIDGIIAAKQKESENLVDPSAEIAQLTAQLLDLNHKKIVSGLKDKTADYLRYLKWFARISAINFAGIKSAVTKKRTEFFNVALAEKYFALLSEELKNFDAHFDIEMHTSGDQGDTVKEFKIVSAEEYSLTQILSEGEQKVCSLADFLTEVQLDKNNSGIIFDDPVTSMDYDWQEAIARRLAMEAANRQVVVFTHDIVFMSKLTKYATRNEIDFITHWMQKLDGVPGHVALNTMPRLADVASLKRDCDAAVKDFVSMEPKKQEAALGIALDHLRSACEALIEEVLFAGTIERYSDHIRVQNLQEAVMNQDLALKIVEFHGRITAAALMHNRSSRQRGSLPGLPQLTLLRNEFDTLEQELKKALKEARAERKQRKEEREAKQLIIEA